jgi:hypothetical protein
MIPDFDLTDNLPPGIHEASIEEIKERFAYNKKRCELFEGLLHALADLSSVGCKIVYIDGSFVTKKAMPKDFDGCWDNTGISRTEMQTKHPIFISPADLKVRRVKQIEKYGGELFPAHMTTSIDKDGNIITYLDFFQKDIDDKPKGIIKIDLKN